MNLRNRTAMMTAASLTAFLCLSTRVVVAAEGQVVEKGTGKPMAGVFVIAKWSGQAAHPVDAATVCVHGEIVMTNEEGRFSISALSGDFNPMITSRRRDVYVYKPGYRYTEDSAIDDLKFVMEPRSGSAEEQFAKVWRIRAPFGCGMNDMDMLPFLKVQAQELQPLARTPQQRRQLSNALFEAESIEFGERIALEKAAERERGGRRTRQEGK